MLAAVAHQHEPHVAERLAAARALRRLGAAGAARLPPAPSARPGSPTAPRARGGRTPPCGRPGAPAAASRRRARRRAAPGAAVGRLRRHGDRKPCASSSSRATRPARSCSSRRCACSIRASRGSTSSSSTTTCRWRTAARPTTRSSSAAAAGDARGALRPQGGHDHARGRRRRGQPQPHPARGDRRQGDHPHRPAHPGRHAGGGRALPDRGRAHGGRRRLRRRSSGARRRTATRSPTAPSASRAASAARWPSTASAPPSASTGASTAGPKWTVSPVYEGMLKEEMDAAAERHPEVPYSPVLIDATYAGPDLRRGRRAARDPGAQPRRRLPVRLGACPCSARSPAPSRCCSRFDDDFEPTRGDGRGAARHRAGAAGQGHRQPDGDDPGRRGGAALRRSRHGRRPASRAIYESVLEADGHGRPHARPGRPRRPRRSSPTR